MIDSTGTATILAATFTGGLRGGVLVMAKVIVGASLAAYLAFVVPLRIRRPLGGVHFGKGSDRPEFLVAAALTHPWEPTTGRIGIACGAGGLRSTAFCLGGLQTMRRRGVLPQATYLTAVSGGSYVAAAAAVTANRAPDPRQPAPFDPSSPEEDWLRNNVGYLAGDRPSAVALAVRVGAGIAVNILVLWLVLFTVSRPVGWLISSDALHPELRGREPFVEILANPVPIGLTLVPLQTPGPENAQFEIQTDYRPARLRLSGHRVVEQEVLVNVRDVRPALAAIVEGRFRFIRQPTLDVDDPLSGDPINGRPGAATVAVANQPKLVFGATNLLTDDEVDPNVLAAQVRFEDPPELRQRSGLTGRPAITIDPWMWRFIALVAAAAGAAALTNLLVPSQRPVANRLRNLLVALTAMIATGAALVLVVLPIAVQRVPGWLSWALGVLPGPPIRQTSNGSTILWAVPVVIVLAILTRTAWKALGAPLRRPRLSVSRAPLAAMTVAMLALVFVGQVQFAAANGPWGTLAGFEIGPQVFPDWLRWLAATAALVWSWRAVDGSAWSLQRYVRQRQSGFWRDRAGNESVPVGRRSAPLWFTDHPTLADGTGGKGPQLVLCGASRLSERGRAPAHRGAVSFTFSASEIGGPQLGWVSTRSYQAALANHRQGDVTIPGATALTGSALSPALGPPARQAVGGMATLLNLRMGAWLPHPQWMRAFIAAVRNPDNPAPGLLWRDRPGWPYYLRELAGRFRASQRYVHVSDASLYDGLGLVELLRRGCTEIYCLDVGNGGRGGTDPLSNALAIAREELGIETVVQPTMSSDPAGMCSIDIAFPSNAQEDGMVIHGRIVVIRAVLAEDSPEELRQVAATLAGFPNRWSPDQSFDDAQFDPYRRLGHFCVNAALDASTPR